MQQSHTLLHTGYHQSMKIFVFFLYNWIRSNINLIIIKRRNVGVAVYVQAVIFEGQDLMCDGQKSIYLDLFYFSVRDVFMV